VAPDGRTLLFSSSATVGPTGYDHGTCTRSLSIFGSCRELYVYRAGDDTVACASCTPSGAPATGMATDYFGENMVGGTRGDPPNSRALSDDGSRVFFSTPEALVPEDTNQRVDAYEYDVVTRSLSLVSTGKSTGDSYVTNADATGDNVFFVTRERLVGWDRDDSYDVYDARVGGGFPEPPATAVPCAGADACRGLSHTPAGYSAPTSSEFDGAGNLTSRGARKRCKRGRVVRRVHGRRRCVPRRARRHRHAHRRATGTHRRSS
jgi:LSD1 subclass zinc finger protein